MALDAGGNDYDRHRVALTDNRDDNGVRRLEQFPLNPQPDPHWPGLSVNPNTSRVRADELHKVATWLETTAQHLAEVPAALSTATPSSYGPESWHEARHLAEANRQTRDAVLRYARELIRDLSSTAAALHTAADRYSDQERQRARQIQQIGSCLDDLSSRRA